MLDRVEVTGPAVPERYFEGTAYRVTPGDAAQFNAIAWFRDGRSQDVTSQVRWESSDANVLSVGRTGLVTSRQRGEARISATLEGPISRSGWQSVIVLPPNSYVVAGQVFESRDPPVSLSDARVTVLNGPLAGEDAVDLGRGYRFFGLSGPTTIRVERSGYQTQDFTLVASDHQIFDVVLQLIRPRPDLSGPFTLTLTAANECDAVLSEGSLPHDARQRRYSASVTQSGPLLSVELSGAAFSDPMPADRRFFGKIDPFSISFDLIWWDANWDFGPPRIVETLPSGEVLVVDGWVEAAASQGGASGVLSGYFTVYPPGVTPAIRVPTVGVCHSANHRFVLSR